MFCSPCVSVRHRGVQISDKLWPSTLHLIFSQLLLPIFSSSKEGKGFTLSCTAFCWRHSTKLRSCSSMLKKWVWRCFFFKLHLFFNFIQTIILTSDYFSGNSQCIFFWCCFSMKRNRSLSITGEWLISLPNSNSGNNMYNTSQAFSNVADATCTPRISFLHKIFSTLSL